MAVLCAQDIAYVRFRAPDLEVMRDFLLDFGMIEQRFDADRLYMRGYGEAPFVHVTERGPAGFVGVGFWAPSEADLIRLAQAEGVEPEQSSEPGGGLKLTLRDPDGFQVELIAGQASYAPLRLPDYLPWNQAGNYPRMANPRRIARGPSHVLRLGHAVLSVADFSRSERWYKERFGLLTSDEIRPQGEQDRPIGAFLRCDRGSDPCDHHTLFLIERPSGPGFIHSAFEVANIDDLMNGANHLRRTGRDHFWGTGRHYLGSQVFDYWLDPWGHEIEHWTDGDKLPADHAPGFGTIDDLLGVQWGMEMPRSLDADPPGLPGDSADEQRAKDMK